MQPMPPHLSVLVTDDEALARKRLTDLLKGDTAVNEILEAQNGLEAIDILRKHRLDIVFLDVQMPAIDGFGVIGMIGQGQMPLTVFVTAYDQYAIHAFDADAMDYLVKPFSDERFAQTMMRAKLRLSLPAGDRFGPNFTKLQRRKSNGAYWDRLVIKTDGQTRFIKTAEISWIEAAGVYVTLHVQGQEILSRTPLNELARNLDPARFVRIHRSSIVNIESINLLESVSHGEFEVHLKDGTRLHLSRNFRAELENRLGQSL